MDPKIFTALSFTASFQLFLSRLFDVKTTVPWGLYLVGKVVVHLNSLMRRRDGTINRKLADFLEIKVPASAVPVNGVWSKDVVIDDPTNVWARIFTPSAQGTVTQNKSRDKICIKSVAKSRLSRPVLVYFHGGGFGLLSADFISMDSFCRTLSRTSNIVVVSVNYRKAPEQKFPVAYDDCFKALEWLQSSDSVAHLPSMADLSRCFLAGDSAGGNIAHFMACRAAERNVFPLQIRGLILLQPFFGSVERTPAELDLVDVPLICIEATDWHWKAFLPAGADRDHPACNVFGPTARDISQLSLPPIFLVAGSLDLLKDHHALYALRIQQMGKPIKVKYYDGGVHGFYFLESLRTKLAVACLSDIKEFIQSTLGGI